MVTPSDTAAPDFPAGPPPAPRDITFLPDPVVDHLLRAVVTLTMELSATRERLRSVERVLDREGRSLSGAIEALAVSPEEDAASRADRERLVASILGPLVNRMSGKD